ncbi:MAG: hypothetical protein MJ075_04220 [Oscillospiraceae bacterium]|nr:hypothetical protein [Oscillospiraceae bacterium]
MKRLSAWMSMILVAALLLGLTGCGRKAQPAPVEETQKPAQEALVPPEKEDEQEAETPAPPEKQEEEKKEAETQTPVEEPMTPIEPESGNDSPEEKTEGEEKPETEVPEEEDPEKAEEEKPVYERVIEPNTKPEDKPEGYTLLRSGTMASDTGTRLNLVAQWAVYGTESGEKLCMDVYVTSYSLIVGPRAPGVTITLDGYSYSYPTEAIDYEGTSPVSFLLGSYEWDMGEDSAAVDIGWRFLGSYGGQELPEVHAAGTIE